ncbi:hypothetical protein BXZ70DRAFT_775421 [Cristinia sonorae]|uniref:Uncharacterized protein n=1 Tax=Cristinia sonorae TaxID=1940300 RepID=A0A8K0UD71_9AGAR|nr:hypothetical protein BXZ70DRAFT_775421 [Cristinia sonorae]
MDRHHWTTHHTSPLERTALWVEAQTQQSYADASPPPSPTSSIMKNSSSPSSTPPQSNRTTASSEQSIATASSTARRRGPPPSPSAASAMRPFPITVPSSSNVHTLGTQRQLPFPQSPPGTGYPMALEVVPPRVEAERSQSKASRPSMVKKRRPSLLGRISSLGDWKKDDGGK